MNLTDLCLACMTHKDISKKCPYCGFDESKYNQSNMALPLRSLLKNRYLIGKTLGSGGFGITYLAWDQTLQVPMAIKEYMPSTLAIRNGEDASIRPNSEKSEKPFNYYMSKFLEEARTLAKLNEEKGIVSVQDVFKEHGTIYIVMYYVSGISLEAYLEASGGRLEAKEGLQVMKVIMTALTKVHKKGLIHRDISPDNIYISLDHEVKLLDFGAARYTLGQGEKTLSIILKRGYAPLEQYLEKGMQGPWTDVYSVGATLYKVLTGKKPKEALDRMDKDTLKSPKALGADISYKIDLAIMKALALKPEDRFQSMADFLAALNEQENISTKGQALYNWKIVFFVFISLLLSFSMGSSIEILANKDLEVSRESYPLPLEEKIEDSAGNHAIDSIILEDLIGNTYEKTKKIYDNFGVHIEVSEAVHSPLYDENRILEQFPPLGTKLKSGDRVKVVLSKGPVKMPDFKDKTLEAAKTFARDKGLNLIVEYVANESYEPGTIIDQVPDVDSILSDHVLTLSVVKKPEDLRTLSYQNNEEKPIIDHTQENHDQVSMGLASEKDMIIVVDDEKSTDDGIRDNPIDISGEILEETMDQKAVSQQEEDQTWMAPQDKETGVSTTGQEPLYLVLKSYELTAKQLQGKFAFNRALTDAEKKTMRHGGRILSLGDDPIDDYLFTFYADVEGHFLVKFKQTLEKGHYHYILGVYIEEMTYNLKLPFEVK